MQHNKHIDKHTSNAIVTHQRYCCTPVRSMAQITYILQLTGTQDSPFDIVLTTLAQIPRATPYTYAPRHNPSDTWRATNELRSLIRDAWIRTCKEATQWRQVCKIWKDCHDEHIATGSGCIDLGRIAAKWSKQAPPLWYTDEPPVPSIESCRPVPSIETF